MLERLVGCPGRACVKALGADRAGEVRLGRFLRNPRVTWGEMVQTACARTVQRVGGRHVLAIQDTTSLRDESNTTKQSLHLHPTIAVDADDGTLLGLVGAAFLRRAGGQRGSTKRRAFDAKESRRWLDATQGAVVLARAGAASVTVVADREGDVWEEFARRPDATELVIRAQQDRVLADGTLLSRCLDGVAELGRERVELPGSSSRRARTAVLAMRACPVRLLAPKRVGAAVRAGAMPATVALGFVEAREIDPPPGVAGAHWLLLTTHPVATLAQALRVVGIYRQRWTVEQVFRTMKTRGFDIEASQVGEGGAFENLATATLIATITVLQMMRERDGTAKRPATDVFPVQDQPGLAAINTRLQGRTARQMNPHPPQSLAWATWICARLGGWNCYGPPPGPITLHRGLRQLKTMLHGWNLGQHVCSA